MDVEGALDGRAEGIIFFRAQFCIPISMMYKQITADSHSVRQIEMCIQVDAMRQRIGMCNHCADDVIRLYFH